MITWLALICLFVLCFEFDSFPFSGFRPDLTNHQIHSHNIVDPSAHRWTHLRKIVALDQEFKQSSPFLFLMLTPPLLHNHNIRQYTPKYYVQPILLFQPSKKYQRGSNPLKATECILDTIGGSVLLSGRESEIDILRYLHHIVHCIVYSFLTGDRGRTKCWAGICSYWIELDASGELVQIGWEVATFNRKTSLSVGSSGFFLLQT